MNPARRVLLACALALVAAGAGVLPATAQPDVAWEPLPVAATSTFDSPIVRALALDTQPDGTLAVYVHTSDTFKLNADRQGWTLVCRQANCSADFLTTRDSVIIGGASNRHSRSGDYGQTWHFPGWGGFETMFWGANPATDGALFAARTNELWRTDDQGRSYTQLGSTGMDTEEITEVPASGALPAGRILAAGYNGVTFSDDGGLTFQPSSLYQPGVLIAYSITVAPEADHPYGGAAYAATAENQAGQDRRASVLYRSDDGGATWTEIHRILEGDYGLEETDRARVRGGRDGSLWVSVGFTLARPTNRSTMLLSRDGGASFEEVSEGWGGYDVNHIRISDAGRVYVATDSVVWRTTAPVIVSEESGPSRGASGASLQISPNPASGAVRIALSLETPDAATLQVYDARGREVHAQTSGARGEHAWEVQTGTWATGVYVVRVETRRNSVSQSFTVAR